MKLKISRLFHWLYATLMFLPLIFFVPSAFYYGLNENASNTETTTINYKYESNEVNTLDDLVVGNLYYYQLFTLSNGAQETISFNIIRCDYIEYPNLTLDDLDLANQIKVIDTSMYFDNDTYTANFYINFNGAYVYLQSQDLDNYEFYNLYFYLRDSTDLQKFKTYYIAHNYNNLPQYTDYNVIESVSVNNDDTISNKMYLAWESVWNLPLFQWTKNSFITAPFSYITGLFGLGSDNSLNCVFTYFASISICWLVFDLIMYVPNLAHRWLDRSAIE